MLNGRKEWFRAMFRTLFLGSALILAMVGSGCSGDPGTGPTDVKWDRFACDRCRMVLSDPKHSAQVRVARAEARSRVYYFDDIGCAVIWLDDKPFRDAPTTEIWTTDWRSGGWIDARAAFYLPGQVTPMEYGLGAQAEPSPDALTFEQAKRHIFDVERRFNTHRVHSPRGESGGSN